MGSYANEARAVRNAPLQHEADPFRKESMDIHFGSHFYYVDKKNVSLVGNISKVIDRLKRRVFKFSFMKAKKE
jgi:hypothetical protein